MNKYGFNVAWSDEDEGYIATCPEFPGLSAFGKTAEAALAEAQNALVLFIKTYQEDGLPLPQPLPVQQYSGQTRLRLPKDLHRQASLMAEAEDVSLNQFIVDAVRTQVTGQQFGAQILKEVRQHLAQTQRVAESVMTVPQPIPRRTEKRLTELSGEYSLVATSGRSVKGN